MAEYTWDDLIYIPASDKAKNAIGKKCYFGDTPNECLSNANLGTNIFVLERIEEDDEYPFISECDIYGCIIVKKEDPKLEYVPFDTIEEFVKASFEHNKNHYLAGTGIWLKETSNNDYEDDCMFTINCFDMDNNTLHSIYSYWNLEEVLKLYKFLDDTPCGKLKEKING